MITIETEKETQDKETQDQVGELAESARRHIAYERLARQVAASEAAARLVVDTIEARPQDAARGDVASTSSTPE